MCLHTYFGAVVRIFCAITSAVDYVFKINIELNYWRFASGSHLSKRMYFIGAILIVSCACSMLLSIWAEANERKTTV